MGSKGFTVDCWIFPLIAKFLENGAVKSQAKHYQNVVNEPLVTGDPKKITLEILNINELHLMTGAVSKIITGIEDQAFVTKEDGKKFVDEFLKSEDISKCVYQGSNSFEGNQARKLLKRVDKLERLVMDSLDFLTEKK